MKLPRVLLVAITAMSLAAWGQSMPPQTPPPGTQSQSGSGAEQSGMQTGAPHSHMGMQGRGSGPQMQAHEMQGMRDQVAKMRTLLDQMKANVAGMSGKDKLAMQSNVQLWQMMIDHMDEMVQHMSSMQGPGMMGPHHGMHSMEDMHRMHGEAPMTPPNSAPPASPGNPPAPPQR